MPCARAHSFKVISTDYNTGYEQLFATVFWIVADHGQPYQAMVLPGSPPLSAGCDCPDRGPRAFCEHPVAVGLHRLGDDGDGRPWATARVDTRRRTAGELEQERLGPPMPLPKRASGGAAVRWHPAGPPSGSRAPRKSDSARRPWRRARSVDALTGSTGGSLPPVAGGAPPTPAASSQPALLARTLAHMRSLLSDAQPREPRAPKTPGAAREPAAELSP